jgi:hypothetical protein
LLSWVGLTGEHCCKRETRDSGDFDFLGNCCRSTDFKCPTLSH